MKDLAIQIQPNRVPGMDALEVRNLCALLAADNLHVSRHATVGVEADDPSFSITFATDDPAEVWKQLWQTLYMHPQLGGAMKMASIVVCEGGHGWDDYLLLYHFASDERLDRLGFDVR